MTFATDDLASVLIAPDREHTGYGQAILRTFNTATFENEVEYRGTVLTNLPVMDRIGALTYQPGDVVLLMKWRPSGGGLGSYWIAGSPVIPGAGRAEAAIAFMQTVLASAVSAEVFAQRVKGAAVEAEQSRTATSYGDLTTVGPTVVDVPVSESGSAIVFVGAGNKANVFAGAGSSGGYMAFAISGATTRAPDDGDSMRCTLTNSTGDGVNQLSTVRAVMGISVTGLNPGLHTFEAKYRAFSADRPGIFVSRNLVVIGL